MNNRNPNKLNTYPNLTSWCEKYHKDSGIKVYPTNIPVDLVLEDLMESFVKLGSWMALTVQRLDKAESEIVQTNKFMLEATEIIQELLKGKEDKQTKVKK